MHNGASELKHLLKLIDDESTVVREAVGEKLYEMRFDLPEQLMVLGEDLSDEQQSQLDEMLLPKCRQVLESTWIQWSDFISPTDQLEQALSPIAAYLSGWQVPIQELSRKLDQLAESAYRHGVSEDPKSLAEYLFDGRGGSQRLNGNQKNFFLPQNGNLIWVMANGLGVPISLVCIYALLGARFGQRIQGCDFPGHFLAHVEYEGEIWLVDCFNRGKFIRPEELEKHHPTANPLLHDLLLNPVDEVKMIHHLLLFLRKAFEKDDDLANRRTILVLQQEWKKYQSSRVMN